jgi:hypothetical protein
MAACRRRLSGANEERIVVKYAVDAGDDWIPFIVIRAQKQCRFEKQNDNPWNQGDYECQAK